MIIGYLPEFRLDSIDSVRLKAITDLIYFGIEPPADGNLPNELVKPSVLDRLHHIKHIADCRLLLCVGGGGRSENFPELAGNTTTRQKFITDLIPYCQDNGFDGQGKRI